MLVLANATSCDLQASTFKSALTLRSTCTGASATLVEGDGMVLRCASGTKGQFVDVRSTATASVAAGPFNATLHVKANSGLYFSAFASMFDGAPTGAVLGTLGGINISQSTDLFARNTFTATVSRVGATPSKSMGGLSAAPPLSITFSGRINGDGSRNVSLGINDVMPSQSWSRASGLTADSVVSWGARIEYNSNGGALETAVRRLSFGDRVMNLAGVRCDGSLLPMTTTTAMAATPAATVANTTVTAMPRSDSLDELKCPPFPSYRFEFSAANKFRCVLDIQKFNTSCGDAATVLADLRIANLHALAIAVTRCPEVGIQLDVAFELKLSAMATTAILDADSSIQIPEGVQRFSALKPLTGVEIEFPVWPSKGLVELQAPVIGKQRFGIVVAITNTRFEGASVTVLPVLRVCTGPCEDFPIGKDQTFGNPDACCLPRALLCPGEVRECAVRRVEALRAMGQEIPFELLLDAGLAATNAISAAPSLALHFIDTVCLVISALQIGHSGLSSSHLTAHSQ
jgi:hypothetical protein